tara:strand:+ start:45 stop:557 length:513 start_codon:yes stop_codon:yes gene_type:complete
MAQPTSGAHSGQSSLNKIYGHVKDVETITAAKTLTLADTGKTLFINYDSDSNIDITLPSATAGAYFKFLWIADFTDTAAALTVVSPGGNGTLRGAVRVDEADASTVPVIEESDDSSHAELKIGANAANTQAGSVLEAISDGTNWYVSGAIIHVSGGGAAAATVTWQAAGA